MKRRSSRILLFLVVLSIFTAIFGLAASASFGSGARVVAADVNMIKTGLLGTRISFSDADFKSALCLEDFDSIKIVKIPSSTEGTLLLDGRRVGEGKIIKRRDIAALSFLPASDSVKESSFKFTVDGGAGTEISCILKFIDKVNYKPSTEAVSTLGKTQEGISYFGAMSGRDPEGDKISYIVVLYPKNGVIEITDKEKGEYCYTPKDGFVGEDSFTYVIRDEYGNYSSPTTVTVSVTERMCQTVYRDMIGRSEYNAAVAMTAMSIMSGKLIGNDFYFMPDEAVCRAEFIAMALKCSGAAVDTNASKTIFDDDSSISPSLKPYINTAVKAGLISGDFKDGGLYLAPNEKITGFEAAKIMATLLGYGAVGEEKVYSENTDIPVWARAGVAAMSVLGIFSEGDVACAAEPLTRAQAAEYLYKLSLIY